MGSGKKVTVGYHYYLGLHFGLCHGPVDALQSVVIGEREAWSGQQAETGTISINKPDLFGGKKREGGVVGDLSILMGTSGQSVNSYLQAKIGGTLPAFRGILSAVWNGGKVTANNPYLKPWAFRVKRILQGWSTGAAWYPEKATIYNPNTIDGYTYTEYWSAEYSFDPNQATETPETSAGTKVVSGMQTTDILEIRLVEMESNAWSPYLGYGGTAGYYPGSTSDPLWWSRISVKAAAGTVTRLFDSHRMTAAEAYIANAAVVGRLTGSSSYQIWIEDTYLANRGSLSISVKKMARSGFQQVGMNSAHIIYQCLTDTAWGMGYPTGSIDADSFTSAADALHSEGFGLSMLWNKQEVIESFIALVLDHIGCMLYVRPDTGAFALKLIRADYDRGTLPQYGPTSLISAEDYQRQAWGETVNEITVVYTDACTEKEASVTVQDIANITIQGGVVAQTRHYPGIRNASLAQRVAMRDLQAGSTPLASIKLTATRAAWQVFPGDVFRLTWPEYDIDDVVFRVLTVNRGTLTDGQIIIDAVEDVFGLPDNTYLVEQPGGWVYPSQPPAAAPYRKLLEAPYWDLARNLSAADLDYVDALSGYLETLAVRPSGDAVNYDIQAKVGAAAYESAGSGDFCPSATVVGALTKTTTAIALANGIDIDLVVSGGYAIIDDEYVLVSAIDAGAGTATISRGLLDTVPTTHSAGARIWFADGNEGASGTEYADGEIVDVKLLPATGQGTLDISLAPADSLTFGQRQYRPYAPGKLLVNGSAYPEWIDGFAELTLMWAHRDRLSQTAYLVTQGEDSIGPEAGTTYTLRLYGETDTLLRTESGLSGTSYTYTSSNEIADSGGTPVEEPYWANVKMLLNMNGADGATTFTDSSGTPSTFTASGNAHTEVDKFKFGGSSGYFDGASDLLIGPTNNAGFNLGAGNFTLDGWICRTNDGPPNQQIAGFWDAPGSLSWSLGVIFNGAFFFQYSLNGSYDVTRSKQTASGAISVGEWTYIEWSRSGTTMRLFVNGVVVLTHNCGTDTVHFPTAAAFKIGSTASGYHLAAYLQDLRLTKGAARNTANYTPPAHQAGRYLYSGDARLNGRLRFELESVRGGLASYQKYDHTVLREGYGFNYGYYYGGQ